MSPQSSSATTRPGRERGAPTVAAPGLVKPISADVMEDTGTGLDFGTRADRMAGHLTPNDRFFVRSHSPTPRIDTDRWSLRIEGDAVRAPVTLTYDDLWHAFPHVSVTRTIECAGNRRVLFGQQHGQRIAGTPWGRGAVGTAEWTGVRLRDLFEAAQIAPDAREVMPEGLDACRARRPLPLTKALADDTVLALAMNGEPLPPDHGHPARVVVSGWLGAASIKWVGRIEVSREPLNVPWNTEDYVLIGPGHPAAGPALGTPIHALPVTSLVELDWPARLTARHRIIRGRAFAGEHRVTEVAYRIDHGPWHRADLTGPREPGIWTRWQFPWHPAPGEHTLSVRATDDRGNTQPDHVPWNHLGYLNNQVLAHPVSVR
ncbi:sulfite oxidase [Streptomyces sp. HNM0574]|uniref:sulfite oxidase n=1 Tax=Streptomyces sp. HNM0574 TaxID=2714954 RepID=UPI00146E57B7|nr:sulfite oxidase [Streptomyces sp. HNM0574]NLU68789.1 sulfite oxidase [Streptomyces sp. HNM0574]